MRPETSNFMVGKMTTRNIVLLSVAAMLAGCATATPPASQQTASAQSAIYVVKDPAAAQELQAGAGAEKTSTVPGESKLMRIYWFLGGR